MKCRLAKRALIICAALVTLNPVLGDEFKNSVVNIKLNKDSVGNLKINLVTEKPYSHKVYVNKKSDTQYVILLPETKNCMNGKPLIDNLSGTISGLSINTQPYVSGGCKGYTKIVITTPKAVNISAVTSLHASSSSPITAMHRPSIDLRPVLLDGWENVETTKVASSMEKKDTQVVKDDAKITETKSNKVIKPAKNSVKISTITGAGASVKTVLNDDADTKNTSSTKSLPNKSKAKSTPNLISSNKVVKPQKINDAPKPELLIKAQQEMEEEKLQQPKTSKKIIKLPKKNIKLSRSKKHTFKLPQYKLPKITLPEIQPPEVKLPQLRAPEIKLPEVKIPEITLPHYQLPNLKELISLRVDLVKLLMILSAIGFPLVVIFYILYLNKKIRDKIIADAILSSVEKQDSPKEKVDTSTVDEDIITSEPIETFAELVSDAANQVEAPEENEDVVEILESEEPIEEEIEEVLEEVEEDVVEVSESEELIEEEIEEVLEEVDEDVVEVSESEEPIEEEIEEVLEEVEEDVVEISESEEPIVEEIEEVLEEVEEDVVEISESEEPIVEEVEEVLDEVEEEIEVSENIEQSFSDVVVEPNEGLFTPTIVAGVIPPIVPNIIPIVPTPITGIGSASDIIPDDYEHSGIELEESIESDKEETAELEVIEEEIAIAQPEPVEEPLNVGESQESIAEEIEEPLEEVEDLPKTEEEFEDDDRSLADEIELSDDELDFIDEELSDEEPFDDTLMEIAEEVEQLISLDDMSDSIDIVEEVEESTSESIEELEEEYEPDGFIHEFEDDDSVFDELIADSTEFDSIEEETSDNEINEPQQEERTEYETTVDGLTVLDQTTIDDVSGFYLVNFENFTSLIGYVKDEVFVLKTFDEFVNAHIYVKPADRVSEHKIRYIVRVGAYKMIVEVTDIAMSHMLDL